MRLRYSAVSLPIHHISLHQGLREVFFRIRRMVSRLIVFISGWRRAASVSSVDYKNSIYLL